MIKCLPAVEIPPPEELTAHAILCNLRNVTEIQSGDPMIIAVVNFAKFAKKQSPPQQRLC